MTPERFVEYLRGGGDSDGAYYAAQLDARPRRAEDAYAEDALRFLRDSDVQIKAWINGEYPVETNWHYDNYDNVLVVLAGRKVVRLLSHPSRSYSDEERYDSKPRLFAAGTDGSNHCIAARYQREHEFVDLTGCPEPDEVILEPGDALFIPAGWLHHVTSKERTVALSHWWSSEFDKTLNSSEFCQKSSDSTDADSLARHETPAKDFADSVLDALRTDSDSSRQVSLRAPTRYFSSAIDMRNTYYFRRAFEVALEVDMHNEDARFNRRTRLERARAPSPSSSDRGSDDFPPCFERNDEDNGVFGNLRLFHSFAIAMFGAQIDRKLLHPDVTMDIGWQFRYTRPFYEEIYSSLHRVDKPHIYYEDSEYAEINMRVCGELRYATWDAFKAIVRSSETDVFFHLGMWLQYAHMMARKHPQYSCLASHRFDVIWRTIERLMDSDERPANDRTPTWGDIFDGMRKVSESWHGFVQRFPHESLRDYSPYSFSTDADITRAVLANRREAVAYRARRLIEATLDDGYVVSIQYRGG